MAMPFELSDQIADNDGDEEENQQLVSQWMCDVCRALDTPQFSNPVVTQCVRCKAFLCSHCLVYPPSQLLTPLDWSTCMFCWRTLWQDDISDSDEGSDFGCSDGSRSRSRSPLPRYR